MQAKGNTFLQADTANITMLVGGLIMKKISNKFIFHENSA